MLQNQIRLDELLGRDVVVRWYEGVALVQAVCRQLLDGDGSTEVFPTASEILLSLDGTVATLVPSGRNAVTTAAHVLARMLSDDVPVRLRLIVAQATGAVTAYPTLLEFSNALAYFERPDGKQILRQLAERAAVAPPRDGVQSNVPAPLPVEDASVATSHAAARNRGWRPVAVGALVAIVGTSAGWVASSNGGNGRLGHALDTLKGVIHSQLASSPSNPPAEAMDTGRGSKPERPRAAVKPAVKSGAAPRPEAPTRAALAQGIFPLPSLPPLHAVGMTSNWTLTLSRPVFYESVEVPTSTGPDEVGEIEADATRIYSGAEVGVIPPRSLYPKLPPDPPPGTRLEDRTVLELLVATDGLVEHVQLRTPPRDIHEFMLVSAAKAWVFYPATVGGHPVRFRHRVLITLH